MGDAKPLMASDDDADASATSRRAKRAVHRVDDGSRHDFPLIAHGEAERCAAQPEVIREEAFLELQYGP